MPTKSITVKQRPLRIGFLIPEGEISAISEVAGIAALLWGGVYSPLIPVGANVVLTSDLIEFFNPDILFPASDTTEIKDLMSRHPFLRTPSHVGREIFYEDWQTKKQNLAVLDVIHLIGKYWEEEFRNKPTQYKSNCALVEWSPEDPCAAVFSVSFGHFSAMAKSTWTVTAFTRTLGAHLRIADDPGVGATFLSFQTP